MVIPVFLCFLFKTLIALLTFSVAIHAHELRALRSEKSKLVEAVAQLDLKRIDSHSKVEEDSAVLEEYIETFSIAINNFKYNFRKNLFARIVLYPTARLCILSYVLALIFSVISALFPGIIWFDICAVGFLLSGLFVLGFGLTKIINDE